MRTMLVGIPARLSIGIGGDPRVALANALFDDVVGCTRGPGVEVEVIGAHDHNLARFDAFVLPGGGDVDPARYGGDAAAPVYDVNPEQDAFDLRVLAHARAVAAPVLAVCRGLQVVNVAFGGTLHEDLPQHPTRHRRLPGDDGVSGDVFTWHDVAIDVDDALAHAFGASTVAVAAAHHQAIRDLAPGLVAIATADDGIVEAVRATSGGGCWVCSGTPRWPDAPATPSRRRRSPCCATTCGSPSRPDGAGRPRHV